MTNQISTQTISFNNQSLITVEQNDRHYVAMKPICENIGLNWASQYQRIQRDEVLSLGVVIITTPTNSGEQQMICLPIEYLNGWLFGIDINRCKPEIRETLIKYKKECYQVLHNYWFNGKAERKTTVDDRTGLRNAVNMLVSKKGLIYSDAYNLVHQYMNVETIEDIPADKLQSAVEYVHKIALEGELIETKPSEPKADEPQLSEHDLQTVAWAAFIMARNADMLVDISPALNALRSEFAPAVCGMAHEYRTVIKDIHALANRLPNAYHYRNRLRRESGRFCQNYGAWLIRWLLSCEIRRNRCCHFCR